MLQLIHECTAVQKKFFCTEAFRLFPDSGLNINLKTNSTKMMDDSVPLQAIQTSQHPYVFGVGTTATVQFTQRISTCTQFTEGPFKHFIAYENTYHQRNPTEPTESFIGNYSLTR